MNVLLSELLRETLAERADAKLTRGERAREDVAPDARRRAREDERAAISERVNLVFPECEDSTASEREASMDVHVDASICKSRRARQSFRAEKLIQRNKDNQRKGPLTNILRGVRQSPA